MVKKLNTHITVSKPFAHVKVEKATAIKH